MARPVNADAEGTKRQILEAASALFAAQGKRASMRSVARAAGVSLATVHHYYGTKQGLYESCVAAMDEAFGELASRLTAIPSRGGTLDEMLEEAVAVSYAFAREHELAVRLTARDAIDKGAHEAGRRDAMVLPGLEEGAALLASLTGAPPGELRLVVRSLAYLIVRYALTEPRELALIVGWEPGASDEGRLHAAVEEHLVFTARAWLSALRGDGT